MDDIIGQSQVEPPAMMVSEKDLDRLTFLTGAAYVAAMVALALYNLVLYGILGERTVGSVPDTITTITAIFHAQCYTFVWSTICLRSWYQNTLRDEGAAARWLRIVATVCASSMGFVAFFNLIAHPLQHLRNIVTSQLTATVVIGIFAVGAAGIVVVIRMIPAMVLDYRNWLTYNDRRYEAGEPEVSFQHLYRHAAQTACDREGCRTN